MIQIVVVYDISDDNQRKRISEICLDYGLDRQQYSVFVGKLKTTHLRELSKVLRPLSKHGQIILIPIAVTEWKKRVVLGAAEG